MDAKKFKSRNFLNMIVLDIQTWNTVMFNSL